MLISRLVFIFLSQLVADGRRSVMKASSGGTSTTEAQKVMIATLRGRGIEVEVPSGEYDQFAASAYRFGTNRAIAFSVDSTDQLGSGASCVEHLNFETKTARVLDLNKAMAWVEHKSLKALTVEHHSTRIVQFLSCAHSAGLNDFNKAARLPGFTTRVALERMITLNGIKGHENLPPFVVRYFILPSSSCLYAHLFTCCAALPPPCRNHIKFRH